MPQLPICHSGSGDKLSDSLAPGGGGGAAGGQQVVAQWQRQGSVPPTAGPPPSVLVHTPVVVGQVSPKRRKLGQESTATLPMLALPAHLQQQHAALPAGQPGSAAVGSALQPLGSGGVFQSPPDATGSHHDESAGFSGVRRVASAGRDEWQAYLR